MENNLMEIGKRSVIRKNRQRTSRTDGQSPFRGCPSVRLSVMMWKERWLICFL